jgi:hypothetical protein
VGALKLGLRVRLTNLLPSVSRLSILCAILNISQPYRPQRPVTAIGLLYIYIYIYIYMHTYTFRALGSLVVKVLGYKPEGRGFVTR